MSEGQKEQKLGQSHILGHIAIVGRPNVGKSTLFNSLLGQRRAITSPESGVTRDVITEQTYFQGPSGSFEVLLSDTGGISPVGHETDLVVQLNERVQNRSLETLERVDLILWVVALGQFNQEDGQLLEKLQAYRHKVILVVNRVDAREKELEAYNFYEMGFERLLMVSALHRRGLKELQLQSVELLQGLQTCVQSSTQATAAVIRIALLGKPNTGKSTLCNTLTGGENSLVCDMPGTTRDVLLQRFQRGGQSYELVDTAGIRRKNKVQENVEYYSVNRAINSLNEIDVAILLIDSREGIQQQDKKIAQQIIKRGRGLIFALNKIDLIEADVKAVIRELERDTSELFPHLRYAPICSLSGLSGKGTRQLLESVREVYEQLNRRIGTGLLNQALQDWVRYYPPPSSGHFKVRYLTQVETNPLRFILFVNRSKGFPQSYLSFLQNQIRKELGFTQVPLQLHLHE